MEYSKIDLASVLANLDNPAVYFEQYFGELTMQVDLRREQLVESIFQYSEGLLKQINQWRVESLKSAPVVPTSYLQSRIDLCIATSAQLDATEMIEEESIQSIRDLVAATKSRCGSEIREQKAYCLEVCNALQLPQTSSAKYEYCQPDEEPVSENYRKDPVRMKNVFGVLCVKQQPGYLKAFELTECHTEKIHSIFFMDDGRFVSCSTVEKTINTWNTVAWECTKIVNWGLDDDIIDLVVCDGQTLIASIKRKSSEITAWDVNSGKIYKTLVGHTANIVHLAFDGRGLLASCSEDKSVRIWEMSTGQCINIFWPMHRYGRRAEPADNIPSADKLKPDLPTETRYVLFDGNEHLATVDRSVVRLWDVYTGKCRTLYKGDDSILDGGSRPVVAFDGRGHVVIATKNRYHDHQLTMFEVETMTPVRSFDTTHDPEYTYDKMWSISFDSAGRLIRSSEAGYIDIYEASTGLVVDKAIFRAVLPTCAKQLVSNKNGTLVGMGGERETHMRVWKY